MPVENKDSQPKIFKITNSVDQIPQSVSTIVGASTGAELTHFYNHVLLWIQDTDRKLPNGSRWEVTPSMREEAYDLDSLTRGIITPFLKNILLGGYDIVTSDNKKFAAMIKDINKFLEDINLLGVFKEDFEDYAIKHGHSYRRKDYFLGNNGTLQKLQRLEPKAMRTYEDIWDSSIKAYHQKIHVNEAFSSTASTLKEYNSWFIPGGEKYIPDQNIGLGYPKTAWENFKARYKVNEITNLRVDTAEKIIAMHKVREGTPAPIDPVILEIWLKRLILSNGPNFILRVLIPFLHIKNGIILEVTDPDGQKQVITTVPQKPPDAMATTDPELYAVKKAAYDTYVKAVKDDADNILRYMAEGGVFGSGPDKEVNVIESGRTISPAFIETMLRKLDESIGMAFGFPVPLIQARGAELATTRTIQDLFNTVYAGSRIDYEKIANELIRERFKDKTWDYTITKKDRTEESGTYAFEDTEAQFKLSTGDVKDRLKIAQTELTTMQALQIAKAMGASRADIQALADERGFGILDLDRFDNTGMPTDPGMFGLKNADNSGGTGNDKDLDSAGKQDLKPENPEGQDERLSAELVKTYREVEKELLDFLGG